MSNETQINQIIDEIFRLDSPKINEARRQQIRGFVESTINGDTAQAYLAINASLEKDKKGAIVYVLTNVRLIKIDIDENEIQSSSFPLDTIIGIERKLVDGDRAQVGVSFQNGYFGLRYSADNKKITEFFQKLDQSRSQGKNPNG